MTLDPQAAALCERIRRAGGGGFAGRTVAEIRRTGLALSGTWSLDHQRLGVVAQLSRTDGATTASLAAALGLSPELVAQCLDDLRRGGYVRARETPDGTTRWSSLISGQRRQGGEASAALFQLLSDDNPTADSELMRDISVREGVTLRVYRPDRREESGPLPVVVFVHGGAWVSGTLDSYDNTCTSVAELAECLVVSVEYRLAPEHPFPVPVEDALDGLRWTVEHVAELGGDPRRIAVMGDSAGGNLTTVIAMVAASEGWFHAALQVLLYPVLDAEMRSPSVAEHADAPLFNRADLEWMYEQYGGPADDWRASPLAATDLAVAPPTLIVVAGVDPVRDDGIRFGARLAEAGITVDVEVFPTMMHGFFALAPALSEASRARELVAAALRRAFGSQP